MSEPRLDGQVALITGAANGIGAGMARQLASRGASVVVCDIDDIGGEGIADEIDGSFLHLDVADMEANVRVVTEVLERFGGLDLVHLNAGIAAGVGLGDDFDIDTYRRIMGINLDGVVFGIHAALPALRARGGGSILVTASMAGLTPAPFDPLYAANKTALVGLVRSLAPLAHEYNVRVNALCPSFAETNIIQQIRPTLVASEFPILEVDDVVSSGMNALMSPNAGECWFVVPGRQSEPFHFRNVPGPRSL